MKRLLGCALVLGAFGFPAVPAAADGDADAVQLSRRAEGLARRAAFHLDEARIERDIRRGRCHDAVLSQTHAVLRMIRYSVERSETEESPRHATMLGVLDRRLDELEADLRTCNGETLAVAGNRTEVIVIVERWVPREDPTVLAEHRDPFLRGRGGLNR